MRPIDADALESIIQEQVGKCMIKVFNPSVNLILQDIRNAPAIETEPDKGWISVKDRLPDENQKCLVYRDIDNDLKITTGIWHSDRKTFDGLRHGTRLENTIAWMPLPEPPKDGDSE